MINESENKDDIAVAGLLGSLPYVEAPKDFDLRVRAKIAAGQPTRVTWFPSAARVAVPLGLMLSVGGYFGYQAVFRSNVTDVSAVTSPRPSSPGDALSTADVSTPDPASMPNIGDTNIRVKTQTADDKLVASANNAQSRPAGSPNIPTSRDLRGGSIDESIKMSKPLYPRGLNPHSRVLVKPKDFDRPGSISAKDVLTQFGAEVVYSGSGWRIDAVKDNSAAQKAGLKNGDIVEAINDQPLEEKTSFKGQFSGKSMRLKRGGATVIVDLKKP